MVAVTRVRPRDAYRVNSSTTPTRPRPTSKFDGSSMTPRVLESAKNNVESPTSRSASYAGLTRVSITLSKNNLPKKMDCRVKPGNDASFAPARVPHDPSPSARQPRDLPLGFLRSQIEAGPHHCQRR